MFAAADVGDVKAAMRKAVRSKGAPNDERQPSEPSGADTAEKDGEDRVVAHCDLLEKVVESQQG